MFDDLVSDLARRQLGVFARFQLLELGITQRVIDRRLATGRWLRLAPGVYGLPGHYDSWSRRLWVVYLAAGRDALVSHHSAAAVYRVRQFPEGVLSVMVPHPQHQRVAGATVHQTRVLRRHHWLNLYGRRTTTLARTLVDLAAIVPYRDLDLAYEDAILTDHLTHAGMSRCFMELMHDGRRGMVKLGSILDARGPGFVPAASELERMLFETCALVGLTPVRQYSHPGRQVIEGCVDGAFVEAKLILEADGRKWHNRVAAQRHDRARDKAAGRVGWQTMRFCHEELIEDPRREAEAILETYEGRCRLLASPG